MGRLLGILFCVLVLLVEVGCEYGASSNDAPSGRMVTSIYNYSENHIGMVTFDYSSKKFKIDDSHIAGAVSYYNPEREPMVDGREYTASTRNCCLRWLRGAPLPELRVVWNVVYDLPLFDGASSARYDRAASPLARPGSKWCSATVPVRGEPSQLKDNLVFHFLNDGTVVVTLAEGLKGAPLNITEIQAHSTASPTGLHCITEIANPWQGISEQRDNA